MTQFIRYLPLLLLALGWELVARLELVSTTALPPLSEVIVAWIDMIKTGELVTNGLASLYRAGAGLALSIAIGGLLGIPMAWSKPVNVLIAPLVEMFYPLPKSALIPVTVIWLGFGDGSKILLIFLGCMLHGLGWSYDDWPLLASGTLAGHMMECAAQLTGGCFVDPGRKDADDPVNIGFPYADVNTAGELVLGKLEDTGGRLDLMTCKEQVLYEMHDPARYITPDCQLDITGVEFAQESRCRVRVTGMKARPRTPTYKVVVGYHDGYIGEGEVAYAGPNALARAKLAEHIVRERLKARGFSYPEIRVDYIGMSSLHGMRDGRPEPYEVRLRIAARSPDRRPRSRSASKCARCTSTAPQANGGGSNAVRGARGQIDSHPARAGDAAHRREAACERARIRSCHGAPVTEHLEHFRGRVRTRAWNILREQHSRAGDAGFRTRRERSCHALRAAQAPGIQFRHRECAGRRRDRVSGPGHAWQEPLLPDACHRAAGRRILSRLRQCDNHQPL